MSEQLLLLCTWRPVLTDAQKFSIQSEQEQGRFNVVRNPVSSSQENGNITLGLQCSGLPVLGDMQPRVHVAELQPGSFLYFLAEKHDLENNFVVDILSKLECSREVLQFRLISFSDYKPVCQQTPHSLQILTGSLLVLKLVPDGHQTFHH